MTTLPTLEILHRHQKELLLAEVAALLHDWQKCIDMAVASGWRNNPHLNTTNKIQDWLQRGKFLRSGDFAQSLSEIILSLANQRIDLKTLCQEGKDPSSARKHSLSLVRILGECHGFAHVDKELEVNEQNDQACDRISTAFGFEPIEPEGLLNHLLSTVKPFLDSLTLPADREKLLSAVQKVFSNAWGDTRRPINEVNLWDWGYAVAGLYKSAIAGSLLNLDTSSWRLLRVNFDVLGLYAKAVKIADLLAYRNAVEEACEQVKRLVEEEYPLGNEVYRDTTGIYFTFPDLNLPAELECEIRRLVEDVEPELAPRIAVTVGDGTTSQEQLKGILGRAHGEALKALKQPFDADNLSPDWEQLWQTLSGEKKWEVCPVCRLRPKEEHAEVCPHCEKRRKSRLETWKRDPRRTIWVGEIADHNDRVVLLAGNFGLDDWLSGDLVQTMLVKAAENNPTECTPKNPSPARLRRVWETCQTFWDDTVLQDILPNAFGTRSIRKHITPDKTNWQAGLYNGKVNGKPTDLFWQPEHNAFLTVSNLQAAGELNKGDTITLENPDTKQKAEVQIRNIREAPAPFDHYQPFLPLHASPDQFLALVPAADAPKIAQNISAAYQKQFGKVRNRLPLSLGLVFFPRKMPLMAVMDAARQMLDRPSRAENWQVQAKTGHNPTDEDWPRAVQLTLTCKDESIPVKVPTVMGDDKTKDLWYPYFQLEGAPAAHHTHQFQHHGKTWVHVRNLQKGDKVCVTPSTFDFLWLDAASRRFEIHYGADGRRPARPSRPFYLEDLDRLEDLWGCLKQLTRTQLKQCLQTIETARERWFGPHCSGEPPDPDGVFRQFVADTLANAQWPKDKPWKSMGIASPHEMAGNDMQTKLIAAGARGELADLAELHLEILKEKNEGEPS